MGGKRGLRVEGLGFKMLSGLGCVEGSGFFDLRALAQPYTMEARNPKPIF